MGFRLMLVEDNEEDVSTCRDSVASFNGRESRELEIVECSSVEEALTRLDGTFDGAIVDLKLADEGDEGNHVIHEVHKLCLRIPIIVLTGTPDAVETTPGPMEVFKKGETTYTEIFEIFWGIRNTGLTRIMGGRGVIEENLAKVFHEILLPQRKRWVEYADADSGKTEKGLLRHTLNHLLMRLDVDEDPCYPEEMYLIAPKFERPQTGSVVKKHASREPFVVLSPACDLVIRSNGKCKTDRILLCAIHDQSTVFPNHPESEALTPNHKGEIKSVKSNKLPYYHWLPSTTEFEGGFLSFRVVESITFQEYQEQFVPVVQISPLFVKDIVARFSSYYARQGQPDIHILD